MDLRPGLSIGSGYDGIGLGLGLVLPGYFTALHVEREAPAVANLETKVEAGILAQSCVHANARSFDGRKCRGKIYILTAGYPCQPFSLAGKRRGEADPRHLWPTVRRIIGEVRPPLSFLENVPGHYTLGFDRVQGDLAEDGYDSLWLPLSAGECGASQKRTRLWCLAFPKAVYGKRIERGEPDGNVSGDERGLADAQDADRRAGSEGRQESAGLGRGRYANGGSNLGHADKRQVPHKGRDAEQRRGPGQASKELADAECGRCAAGQTGTGRQAGHPVIDEGKELGDAGTTGFPFGPGFGKDPHKEQPPIERAGLPLFPPGRGESDREEWERVLRIEPGLEPAVCRIPDGASQRVDRLRLCGNGVVPLVAAIAFSRLFHAAFGLWPWELE